MDVPAFSVTEQFQEIEAEVMAAVHRVLAGGHYILGPEVEAFEQELAAYCGTKHAIGVANGSDALHIALMALGIGPGDEVLVPAFTFFATAGAVSRAGATPVFCDIDLASFNIDVEDARRRVTPRTKAIIPVHLFGRPADMQAVGLLAKEHGLKVVEDAAQAIGAELDGKRIGSFGDLACFSFYPTKNLGACGDAGAIVTNDDNLAERVRMLRVHGSRKKYFHEELGYNSRLDELQAAILRVKLRRLEKWISSRIQIAAMYADGLKGTQGLAVPDPGPGRHVFHQYTVRTSRRDALKQFLADRGIGSTVYYPQPLHRQAVYQPDESVLPQADRASMEVLSLPMYPELSPTAIEYVVDAVDGFFKATGCEA